MDESVELIELDDYDPDLKAQILDGERDASGVDHLGVVWRDKVGHVVLRRGGLPVAQAGWLPIRLTVGDEPMDGVGLGGVLVHRSVRSHGFGAKVVRAAMERMRQQGEPLGLLFCRPELVEFYGRLGWREVPSEVTAEQPHGTIVMPVRTCWTPMSDMAELPPGPIAVQGLPF
jgi:GNAT superfamily N-acetyltransferase